MDFGALSSLLKFQSLHKLVISAQMGYLCTLNQCLVILQDGRKLFTSRNGNGAAVDGVLFSVFSIFTSLSLSFSLFLSCFHWREGLPNSMFLLLSRSLI